jgi:HSP20 family protein
MKMMRFGYPHYQVNRSLVDDLFDGFLYNDTHACQCNQPATNVVESENGFRIELAIPGVKKEQVSMNFNDNTLTIKAEVEKTDESKNDVNGYLRKEFRAYNFEKQFTVPENVDDENISARFENGVLFVTLPKKEKEAEKAPVAISIL